MSKEVTEEQNVLRKQLQKLNTVLFSEYHDTRSRLFGEIATIIEAVIPDETQAKAVKDLVSNKIYGSSIMDNVIDYQLKQIAEANGFELYSELPGAELAKPENAYTSLK